MKTIHYLIYAIFLVGIIISMLTCQTNYHQQTFAQSYMTNIEEEKTSAKEYNNNFIIKISTEEGTDADDGLSNQELCNKYLEEEGCEISGPTTIPTTTAEQNVTQRLEEKLLEDKPESIPAPPPPSPPTIPFQSFTNDSFSMSDTQLALNSTGQFSNASMGNVSQ